jgi:hypothetical protein
MKGRQIERPNNAEAGYDDPIVHIPLPIQLGMPIQLGTGQISWILA